MTLLWIFWGIDALAFVAAIYFFVRALSATHTTDITFFIGWFVLMVVPYASLSGSSWAYMHDHLLFAFVTAAIPAIPATLYVLLTLLVMWPEPATRLGSYSLR
ncbi:hypothetical protein [Spirosoma areae]